MIYLTSKFSSVSKSIYADIGISNPKTAFIYTAAEKSFLDSDWVSDTKKSLIDNGFLLTDYTISGKTLNEIKLFLDNFEVVYVLGGDTFYLLEQSRISGFDTFLKEYVKDGVYIGHSAGSVLLGTSVSLKTNPPKTNLKNFDGLGIVNFTIIPHWGKESVKESKKALFDKMYSLNSEILLLRDNAYIVSDGKNHKIKVIK